MPEVKPDLGQDYDIGDPSIKDSVLFLSMLGTGDLEDYSGNKNDGTNNGGVWDSGKYGPVLRFDGTAGSQLVDCGTSDDLWLNGNPVTMIFVTTANSAGGSGAAHLVQRPTGNIGSVSISASQRLTFQVNGTTDLVRASATNSMPFGVRKHFAVTWDGSNTAANVHMYFDGIEVSSYVATVDGVGIISNAGANFVLGNRTIGGRQWDGTIEYCNVYNKVLSADAILKDFETHWQAWEQNNIVLWAAAQAVTANANLLDGPFHRYRKIG